MYVDSLGSIGVTTDPQKVRPGMIYVDLSCRRNRRQIYEAYGNGAYLIFTPHNISDPELPVIKIEDINNTLHTLFDRLISEKGKSGKLVAIFGDSDKSMLAELIQNIKVIPVTIDTNPSNLLYPGKINFDCGILTDGSCISDRYGDQPAVEFMTKLFENKVIIINNDEPQTMTALGYCKGIIPITYGLNKKASVTASSIDVGEITCFNYCVQKGFKTRSGNRIDPFEIPIHLNALGSHNIYDALAAITCGLYYDLDIAAIKKLVESYKAPARHFQRINDFDFTIIDNYCNSISDYNSAFESIQILSYENLVLIISVSQKSSQYLHRERAHLITEWAGMLKCKEVILTSCMDFDSQIGELPLKNIRIYRKIFKENNIKFRYYHLLQHAIDRSMSELNKRDLLVMLGSDEMNTAHKLLSKKLRLIGNAKH